MSPHDLSNALFTAQRLVLRQMASGSDFRETLCLIARTAEQVCPPMQASILYWDAERGALRAGGSGKLSADFVNAVDGLVPGPAVGSCGTAAFRKRRVITSSVAKDPLWATFRDFAELHQIRSAWSTPLLSRRNGTLLGVFGMYYPMEGTPSAEDLQIADHFSELATVALERVLHEEELRRLSRLDPLTGVLNRTSLLQNLRQWIGEYGKSDAVVSVAAFDIDHFQYFNQVLGRQTGDEILHALAARISERLPAGCHFGRLSGDRFLLFSKAPAAIMEELAHTLIDACRPALPVGANGISVSVSVATTTVGGAGGEASIEIVLDELAHALKRRSTVGRNAVIPVRDVDRARVNELRNLRTVLTEAIAINRFTPYFQPVVDLVSNECVGLEAMIRFPDALGLPIQEALYLAAASPLLSQIGFGMFERVCEIVSTLRSRIGSRFVSVNLSAAQLIQDDIAFRLHEIVARFGVSPQQILLEIENVELNANAEPLHGRLAQLHKSGFRLALDGLEHGNCYLGVPNDSHFEMVKVAGCRTESAAGAANGPDSGCVAVFSAVRLLAASANVAVCAKNLETAEDCERAKAAGFRYGQGFYWSRPQPIEEILGWLDRHSDV